MLLSPVPVLPLSLQLSTGGLHLRVQRERSAKSAAGSETATGDEDMRTDDDGTRRIDTSTCTNADLLSKPL